MYRPIAGAVLEQTAEIEHAGALLVEIEFPRERELIALGHELIAAAMGALGLVPEALTVPGRRTLGKDDTGIGDALGARIALELARGLVAQCLAGLVGSRRDGRRSARRGNAPCVEVVDGHVVCLLPASE